MFDLYLSRKLIEINSQQQAPDEAIVVLCATRRRLTQIGFSDEARIAFQQDSDEVMRLFGVMQNTVQYRSFGSAEEKPWRIYVPHEVFKGFAPPEHLGVRIVRRESLFVDG